jgi:hypothetical protein
VTIEPNPDDLLIVRDPTERVRPRLAKFVNTEAGRRSSLASNPATADRISLANQPTVYAPPGYRGPSHDTVRRRSTAMLMQPGAQG